MLLSLLPVAVPLFFFSGRLLLSISVHLMNKNSTVSTLSSVIIADKDCGDSAKHFIATRFVDFETRVTTQINSSLHVYRSFHHLSKQKLVNKDGKYTLKSVHLPSLKQFVENKQR